MQLGLLLDVVVAGPEVIVQLLALEDQVLQVGRDVLLALGLQLHLQDGGVRRDIQGDRLARDGLHENLHGLAHGCELLKLVPGHGHEPIEIVGVVGGLINYNM